MRSPLLAFTVLAITSVTPTLAAPAPQSPRLNELDQGRSTLGRVIPRQVPGLPAIPGLPALPGVPGVPGIPGASGSDSNADNTDDDGRDHHDKNDRHHKKRAWDWGTAGGNAYTGATGNTGGGSIINHGSDEEGGVTNDAGTNMAGDADDSTSGDAGGGNGGGYGPGGNAYTGAAGPAHGGDVINEGGGIGNTDANTGGAGADSDSGDAVGGDADDDDFDDDDLDGDDLKKRSYDWGTAGGNAYTGATSNASGGTIVNDADSDGMVTNAGGNVAGDSGESDSGEAIGGAGFGHGPGGNAYSGATGKSHGGDIINNGGGIDNTVDMTSMTSANQAGDGDESESGDAFGGNADDEENGGFDDGPKRRSL